MTRAGPRYHVLDGEPDPPRGMGNFRGLSGRFQSIGNLRCSVAAAFAAKRIIQSPITSCSRISCCFCFLVIFRFSVPRLQGYENNSHEHGYLTPLCVNKRFRRLCCRCPSCPSCPLTDATVERRPASSCGRRHSVSCCERC